MVKKVEMFTTDSGKSFLSEETAYHQEAVEKLIAIVPQLTMLRTTLEGSISQIAIAMVPLAGYMQKTTPEAIGENHPEGYDAYIRGGIAILSCRFCQSEVKKGLGDLWHVTHQPSCPEVARHAMVADLPAEKSVAMGQMQKMGAPARDWLTRYGFENLRDFDLRSNIDDLTRWQRFVADPPHNIRPSVKGGDVLGEGMRVERIWLDGKPCHPYTGDPCPYNHPAGTTCPNCQDWTFSAQDAADVVEVAGEMGYSRERPVAEETLPHFDHSGKELPPVVLAQTEGLPIDHGELAGTCDCSAGMNGASDHAKDCPSYRVPRNECGPGCTHA